MANYEKIGKYPIYFNETYYIAYAGGHRELPKKEQKEWDKTLHLPEVLQVKERRKIGFEGNPNVVPLKGHQLLAFIKELDFVPLFDSFFEQSHVVKLTDIIVYESIKAKSYDIALKG
jgi:hypothetical protein